MSFQGINFANQRLLPSDDGRLYQNIFNDGALYGCAISYSGTKLTIAQGHLVIGGRQIEIESAEVLDVNQAVSGFAQIVIAIDLTKTATISTFNQISIEVRYAAAEDGFSTLTQTDINGSGSYYEAQLALLSLGTGGITGIVQNMPQAAFKGAAEGGGSSLNLHVVGGTAQPASPKENTVWVNTDTEITGYAFSATEPENPADGMVWVKTGAISPVEMNVDKKNTVMVYPISCKQYVSGAGVDKTAKTYQGGQWHDWGIFLYNYGETDLSFTFTTNSFSEDSGLASNHIYLVATYKSQANVTAAAEPAIDLTPYSIAKVEMSTTLTDGSGTTYVGFGKTKGSYSSASYSCSSLSLQVVEIDISSLSGEYFFTAYRDAGAGETKIYSVYLQ